MMGVDFLACETCGDTFPDCGDYVSCECGRRWCSDSCAESDGFREEEDGFTPKDSNWGQDTSCDFCRGEDFEDYEILAEVLALLGKTRKDIIEILKVKKEAV
jgi:hypothetical protein